MVSGGGVDMEGCHEGGVTVVVEDLEEDSPYKACSDSVFGRVWTWKIRWLS